MARFWRLREPAYDSDYRSARLNGSLEHPYGLPGVRCDACDQTWSGSRILPVLCPDDLRTRKHIADGWPIPAPDHLALRREVAALLRARGHPIDALAPGDRFQPGYLDVPAHPEQDFLWASLGSVVVSDRIKGLFEERGFAGAAFVPVVPRRIGRPRARGPAPVPSTGEPEDLIDEVRLTPDPSAIGPYHEMVVTAESARPPGAEVVFTCAACGRESFDAARRALVMNPAMWRGQDVFFLATTLWIVVTEHVKAELTRARASNICFDHLPEGTA